MATYRRFVRGECGYGHSGKVDYDTGSQVTRKNEACRRTMRRLKKRFRRHLDAIAMEA
jgi:hypothetical protein